MAGVIRTYLGWQRPLTQAVAQQLASRWPGMDFSQVMLVASGGRAGRRIVSLLADIAQARNLAMIPPDVRVLSALGSSTRPVAGEWARSVAWVAALRQCEAEARRLFPRLSASAGLAAWRSAAGVLDECKTELAEATLTFADVARQVEADARLGDAERWECAARIHAAYRERIAGMGLGDGEEWGNLGGLRGTVVLGGIAVINEAVRRALRGYRGAVEALVYAPEELADCFDEFGCVKTTAWRDRTIDLSTARLRVVQTAAEQAEEVFATLAMIEGGVRSDQVTIGVPDGALAPYMEATAQNLRDVPVRYGGGWPMSQTRPYQLLGAVAEYLQTRAFRAFVRLAMLPDMEAWLRTQTGALQREDWRSLLDEYGVEYLPNELGEEQRQPEGWRGDPDRANELAWLFLQVTACLGELWSAKTDAAERWAEAILGVLARVYGVRAWNQNDEADRRVVQACLRLKEVLEEVKGLAGHPHPSSLPGGEGGREEGRHRRAARATGEGEEEDEKITAEEAVGAVLGLAGAERIPPRATGNEIDMIGWLELLPDDAEHLIITGFNDGVVPEASRASPFLTNTLRGALGLMSDEDRYARDAYLLTAMLASRPAGRVTLIAGRVSPAGDPLRPSRLVFACDRPTMAKRVLEAAEPTAIARPGLAWRFGPAPQSGFAIGATVLPHGATPPLSAMSVTSFRDYLRSPQGFYLRHVLKVETIEETAPRELDARQCGQLAHDTMKAFADGPARDSDGRQECLDAILGEFDRSIAQRFGGSLPGVLKFQIELMRKRLAILAEWQAAWRRSGWRIFHTEWQPKTPASLLVDQSPMALRGRIDRIDVRDDGGEWAVLDYKVGAKKTPESQHQRAGAWRDLQLPLYRHLASEVLGGGNVQLGYICVADREGEIGEALAGWDAAALADADAKAHEVVRAVRHWEFTAMGDDPPTDGVFGHIFGSDLIDEDAADGTEEGAA